MARNKNADGPVLQQGERFDLSEARFRTIFDTAAVGIGMMSMDRILMDANPAFCRMFGMPREELIGQNPAIITYPEDFPASTQQFRDLLSGRQDYFWGERRYVRKNGEVFWAHVTMSVVRGPDGMPLYLVGMLVDIDERKRAMLELNESMERFRATFDSSAIGIGLFGLDGKILRANATACKVFGYTEDELKQRFDLDNVYPEDHEIGQELLNELIAGARDSFQVEKRYIRKNGEIFWACLSLSAVREVQGRTRYLVGMIDDIDDQKRVMAKLQTSELRFRTIYENAPIGIALVGLDGYPLAVNPAILKMTGYTEAELLAMTGLQLSLPEDSLAAVGVMHELVQGTRETFEVEARFVRKNGQVFWTRQRISTVRSPDGRPAYLIVMVEDIDERKRTQIELEESERRFRALFENVSIGMAMVSLDRRILAINETTERIIGFKAGELVGRNPADLALPEDRLIGMEGFQELIEGKRESLLMEKRYVRKNGEVFWARITYLLVRSPDGQPHLLAGSIEDINDQKMAAEKLSAQEGEYLRTLEQRVEERTRELSEANLRLVGEIEHRQRVEEALASKAAEEAILAERTRLARDLHDAVTQTLFSASLIAEVLPELWTMDEAEARKSTEELRQLTRGALAEMRTLLLELRPAALTQAHFPDLLRQLSEAVIGRARLPVNLDVSGDYEMPPEVKVAFYRIAQEGLNNIVKYARASRIEIRLRQEYCNVHLEIRDNGVGFDTASLKPTSLGMRIMRERAETIHARLRITSRSGQGTSVSLAWNADELTPKPKSFKRVEL